MSDCTALLILLVVVGCLVLAYQTVTGTFKDPGAQFNDDEQQITRYWLDQARESLGVLVAYYELDEPVMLPDEDILPVLEAALDVVENLAKVSR